MSREAGLSLLSWGSRATSPSPANGTDFDVGGTANRM
jgi:hypothetical protein